MSRFLFEKLTTARANTQCCNDTIKSMWHGFCFRKGVISFVESQDMTFTIGNETAPAIGDNASYAFRVSDKGVSVAAVNAQALTKGILALMTRIKPLCMDTGKEVFYIDACEEQDSFDIPLRMVHLCVFPETALHFLQKTIRMCAMMQYTHVIIEFWGTLKFDCFPLLAWPEAYSKEEIKPIIDEVYELGMEPVPMFNLLGHASSCRHLSGKHVVLDQDPSQQMLFGDDGWTWDIKNPDTLELLRNIRHELYDLFGNCKDIHIGCDEAYLYGSDLQHAEEFAEFLSNTVSEILDKDHKRPIMWGDMLLEAKSCGVENSEYMYYCSCRNQEIAEKVLEKLDRRVLIADWQYNIKKTSVVTIQYLMDRGFEVVGCSWNDKENVQAIINTVRQTKALGYMATTWHTLSKGFNELYFGYMLCNSKRADYEMPKLHVIDAELMSNTSMLIRKVMPFQDYRSSGWIKDQVQLSVWY